ncbi:MAG: hypothetical protein ACXAEN_27060 [Candidatus Thorarchaeota archaeon]
MAPVESHKRGEEEAVMMRALIRFTAGLCFAVLVGVFFIGWFMLLIRWST